MNDLENRLRESFQRQVAGALAPTSLADGALARGRRTRQAQVLGAGLSVLAVMGAATLVLGGGGHSHAVVPAHTPAPRSGTTAAEGDVADAAWVAALQPASGQHRFAVAVGKTLLTDAGTVALDGDPLAVTVVPSGVIVTVSPVSGHVETSYYRPSQANPVWTVGNTSYGHAVDPTGSKVALGIDGHRRVVVDIATGERHDDSNVFKQNDEGVPVAWTSSGVLVSAGDGGDGHADLWQPSTGANRRLGALGRYGGAQDMVGDVVALNENDGPCVEVSRLSQTSGTEIGCQGEVRLGAGGQMALIWGDGSAQLITISPRSAARLDAPRHGVVSAALHEGASSEVDLAVRAVDGQGRPVVLVVTCQTEGQHCEKLVSVDDPSAPVVAARFVGFLTR